MPNLGGFTGAVQWQAGETSATTGEGNSVGLSGTYTNGGFSIGAGFQSVKAAEAPKADLASGQSKESAVEGGTTPDVDHSIFTLAHDHFLSKRTDVYAAYMLDDEDQAGWKKGNTFAVGIRHRF
ncbi:porin [Aquabacterium sp.]|uniref:porin n=1 Tax=Aquabacterium sp. TaxID=1872578 RepID=UPI001984DED7|nr:porin [Aquabacterium sp.]MBC7701830.1 porin [Aquabacterium sp.]